MAFLITSEYSTNQLMISETGMSLGYSAINECTEKLSKHCKPRSLVFCLCKNEAGALLGYCSFLQLGIVPLMLDATKNLDTIHYLSNIYHPNYIWAPSYLYCPELGRVLYQDFGYTLTLFNDGTIRLHDDLALLLTTSGSTGSPKLVRLSYENLLSNANSIAEYLSIDENERPVTSLPMHYSFGLSIINSHLLKGATLLLTDKSLMEKEFWSFLKREQATSLSGVPYTYEMLKRLRFSRMDLPSLKTLTQAGGKLNMELNREFAEFCQSTGKRFFVMYGQTEATARMSYLPCEQALSKLGSIGIAIPGGKFQLIDENKQAIEDSEMGGELVYQGNNVSLGYAESADDLAKEDENKKTLYTGDLAKRDKDGYYYIIGRKKRFIKLFGNRINLDEAETILKIQYADCACVGTDDKMIIYTTEKGKEAEIRQYISAKINIHFNAFEIRAIGAIPKNSSGKTIYAELSL